MADSESSRKKKNIRVVALSHIDSDPSEAAPVSSSSSSFSGYAIYLEDSKSIADWIDLQVLISQENLRSLCQETLSRLKERGTAVFKTREQAENALCALEKSL